MRLVLVKLKSVQLDDCDRVIRCPLRLRDEHTGGINVFLYILSLSFEVSNLADEFPLPDRDRWGARRCKVM